MKEKRETLLLAMAISALLYGLRILFLEIPQILLSESGSFQELRAIGRLTAMPFYFLLTTGTLYFVISWIKNRKLVKMNKENEPQKKKNPFEKIWLFAVIVIAGFIALSIQFMIMLLMTGIGGLFTVFICLLVWLPAIVIGFIIFLIILKTRYEKFITLKSVRIFSVILAIVIILPAIFFCYVTIPPQEVTNQWHYDKNQEISEVLRWMGIHYDNTYITKSGYLYEVPNATQGTDFEWEYDKLAQVITMTEYDREPERIEDWELLLRLEIKRTESHYTMTTYYISDVNFTLFDPLLFDNTTWKGSLNWEDQGYSMPSGYKLIVIVLLIVFSIVGCWIYVTTEKKQK